jgi:hypothetical protein
MALERRWDDRPFGSVGDELRTRGMLAAAQTLQQQVRITVPARVLPRPNQQRQTCAR